MRPELVPDPYGGGVQPLHRPRGVYQIWINGSHYVAHSVYLNASNAGTVDLGAIAIAPLDRITGRVLIDPWESLFGRDGEGANGVALTACTPSMLCGPLASTSSDGSFNLSAPAGTPDTLRLVGGGPAGQYGNTMNGYNGTALAVDVSRPFTALNGSGPGNSVALKILGGLTGNIHESVGSAIPPAAFAVYALNAPGFVGGATGYWIGGAGTTPDSSRTAGPGSERRARRPDLSREPRPPSPESSNQASSCRART